MLRSTLGIKLKDRVSKVKMKERLNAIEIGYLIKKLKFKYVGHMARGDVEKWNFRTTVWVPYDLKRKKGRPGIKYIDEIMRAVGPNWASVALNRRRWKGVT